MQLPQRSAMPTSKVSVRFKALFTSFFRSWQFRVHGSSSGYGVKWNLVIALLNQHTGRIVIWNQSQILF
jgi:hypothetical protein